MNAYISGTIDLCFSPSSLSLKINKNYFYFDSLINDKTSKMLQRTTHTYVYRQ